MAAALTPLPGTHPYQAHILTTFHVLCSLRSKRYIGEVIIKKAVVFCTITKISAFVSSLVVCPTQTPRSKKPRHKSVKLSEMAADGAVLRGTLTPGGSARITVEKGSDDSEGEYHDDIPSSSSDSE